MARFLVKASEFKNVCKAVNDRKLAELKKEIIEILKKQDEKEVKKAIDYFNSQEEHYTHLEKSFNGKWVEKAGYGVGTVRIWKGKKYKKIAPGKWARVFEKEGRGTNIAIGKLIAKVQKIDNVEDLMAFVMANKQRFVDENGVDLPVLDKLRAAVDARNGSVGSKGTSKPAEKKEELSWKDKVLMATDEGAKKELGRGKMYKKHITDIQRIANSNINDIPEKLKTLNDFIEYQDSLSNPDYKQAGKDYARLKNHELAREIWKKVEDGEAEWDDNGYLKLNEHGLLAKPEKKEETDYVQKKRDAKEGYWSDEFKERNMNNIKQKIVAMKEDGASDKKIKAYLEETIETNSNDIPWRERAIEEGRIKGNQANDYRDAIQERTVRIENCKELLKEYESETEKHQNRSDAMKGNQNAKKYGLTDEQIERYDIQEVVEDVNGYGIVKNSEGKYSYIDDGRVKDRPDDFETSIEKVKERINDTYETKKNIQAAKDYDFKNAKLGSDIEYSKRSDGRHLYFKKSPDGSKAISVTVEVSDMREPLNMVYEVSDTKTGESWQYETAYGNKEGLEWAVERPEQMEKEIKKFFKRDPNKEWNKQNTFDKEPSGIGTFEKIDTNTVEMPTDKATRVLFDNLNKSRSTEKAREFMTDCYYDGENLVATDGKRLTIIKTGNVGFEPGYVNVKTDGGKVTLERIEKKELRSSFPNYKKVIPENNNQEVKLNNKVLTEKLKEMRKNGSISKDIPKVALNFENGKVMLDGVQVGTADNVSFDDERQRIIVNANYLKDALNSGETSNMFVSDNPNKAMVLKTDISDTIVMPFTNDVDVEYENKTSKNESASFERVDFKSMSDDELKDYEEKLSKELDELNANSPEFVEKYNYWREVHGENNDRFHQRIEDEARAEKQAEADAKAQKENEIKERYNGYFDGKKGLDKARDLKLLEKKYNFEGKGVMTSKDFVEQAIDNGEEIREREVNKLDYPSRTRWNRMNNYEQEQYEKRIKAAGKKMLYSIGGYEFPKGVVDYAKFYKEKGKSNSENEKTSKSETAIKNKATSLAGAFGYSKNYATKMGSPFNLELAEQTVDEELDWDDGSKKALKEELRRIYSEKKVQKSIVDDFVMDMLVDEDEEDFEVRKIDESLWNDYSAEQPELFNSTEMMVREAFNRHGNCL